MRSKKSSGRVGKAVMLMCFFTAGYNRQRNWGWFSYDQLQPAQVSTLFSSLGQIQRFFNNCLLAFENASHHQHSLPNHLHTILIHITAYIGQLYTLHFAVVTFATVAPTFNLTHKKLLVQKMIFTSLVIIIRNTFFLTSVFIRCFRASSSSLEFSI